MCYESLVDGDATENSIGELLRGEATEALLNGVVAGAVVALVLASRGFGAGPVVALGTAAVLLGAALHQVVLLAGVAVLRARAAASAAARPNRAT